MSLLISFCLLVSPVVSLTAAETANNSGCQLRVAWTEWKPLQYIDQGGQLTGLQVDFIKAIARVMKCQLSWSQGRWRDNLDKIKKGEADMMANATASPERKKYAYFSIPYRRDNFALYIRTTDKAKFGNLDLETLMKKGFRLGLTRNYLYGPQMAPYLRSDSRHQIHYADVSEDNFVRADKNEIDGFLEDPFVISFKLRSHDLSDEFSRTNITLEGLTASFIFSKETITPEFVARFNRAMNQVRESNPLYQTVWFQL